mgnify:CR=1 FL=1
MYCFVFLFFIKLLFLVEAIPQQFDEADLPTNIARSRQTQQSSCYLADTSSNQTVWGLVWQDDFEAPNISISEWTVQHEAGFCGGTFGV